MGGYPEMRRRETRARRQAWARDYVSAIVRRDVRDIADVERLDQMSRLLRILGHHSGQLANFTQIGGQIGLDDKTTKKYVAILDVVVENDAGDLVGIEIKAAASVNARDFKGLKKLAEAAAHAWRLGVVLYDGDRIVPFGARLYAAPVSCLWG